MVRINKCADKCLFFNCLSFMITFITVFLAASVKSSQLCRDDYIGDNIERADIILAGTVRNLNRNFSSEKYGAMLEIHRIIKGRVLIYDIFNLKMEYIENRRLRLKSSNPQKQKRLTVNGNTLFVHNFGDSKFCQSDVKPHDVRIFLLTVDDEKQLHLSSSVIQPISKDLRNLNSLYENQFTDRCNYFF